MAGDGPSSTPQEGLEGASTEKTEIPQGQDPERTPGADAAEEAATRTALEKAIKADEEMLKSLKEKMRKPHKSYDFPYGQKYQHSALTPQSIVDSQIRDVVKGKLQDPTLKKNLERIGIQGGKLDAASMKTLTDMIHGLMVKFEDKDKTIAEWEEKFSGHIKAMLEGAYKITTDFDIPIAQVLDDINELTGMEIFLSGKPILNGGEEGNGFITFITTYDAATTIGLLRKYYETRGRLQENKGEVLGLSIGKTTSKKDADIGALLKKHGCIQPSKFRKEGMEKSLEKAVTKLPKNLRKRARQHLTAKIEGLKPSAEDEIKINEKGEVTVISAEETKQRVTQAVTAAAKTGKDDSFLGNLLTPEFKKEHPFFASFIALLLSLFGIEDPYKTSGNTTQEKNKPDNKPDATSPGDAIAEATPEAAETPLAQAERELLAALKDQGIERDKIGAETMKEILAYKNDSEYAGVDWDVFIREHVDNDEAELLRSRKTDEETILAIFTTEVEAEEEGASS